MKVAAKAERAAYRKVLRLVDGYLAKQPQRVLQTDGRGWMTWAEVRYHIKLALSMKTKGGGRG